MVFLGSCCLLPLASCEWSHIAQLGTLHGYLAFIWCCWLQDGGTADILPSGQTHGTAGQNTFKALQGKHVRSTHHW